MKTPLTRRTLLQRGLASIIAYGVAPQFLPASLFGKSAPSNRLAIGLVGNGLICSSHLGTLLELTDDCRIVATCDVLRSKAEKARDDIDVVFVTTPDHWHAAVSAADAAARESARTGALLYLERNRDTWLPATTTVLARLIAATKTEAPRRQLVSLLARANDQTALELTRSLQPDAVVGEGARYAAAAISATLAGPPKVRTSTGSGAVNILDGKTSTRWTTQALGEEWVEIDFRQSQPFRLLTLDQTGRAAEFPERYEVDVTDDPKSPGSAVVTGQGQRNKTVITLPAGTQGRYVIIKNTAERKDPWWAISELYLD